MRKSLAPRIGSVGRVDSGYARLVYAACTVLLSGACIALFGCAAEEGIAPNCTQDVNASGHQAVEKGCNPFPACSKDLNGDGKLTTDETNLDVDVCCGDLDTTGDGKDYLYQICLYGYGAAPLPSSGNNGAGGSGS